MVHSRGIWDTSAADVRYWAWLRRHLPDLLSGSDGPAGEEGDAGEAQVLVGGEDPHSQQVGFAQVVDEAADVAVESGVDAVNVSNLHGTTIRGQVRCLFLFTVFSFLLIFIRDDFNNKL